MTPEAQRIAIAEACGWKKPGEFGDMWHHPKGHPVGFVPSYLSDLNAMHEAEKVLDERQYIRFAIHLNQLWLTDNTNSRIVLRSASATAAQRCEAFLRTLNLWLQTK